MLTQVLNDLVMTQENVLAFNTSPENLCKHFVIFNRIYSIKIDHQYIKRKLNERTSIYTLHIYIYIHKYIYTIRRIYLSLKNL